MERHGSYQVNTFMPFDVNKKTKVQAQNIRQFDVLGKKRKAGTGRAKLKSFPAYKKNAGTSNVV